MAEAHVDHPGDVSWFAGKGPLPVIGPCPHTTCSHDQGGTIAWGPDHEHYTLNVCVVPEREGGCGGTCRGWAAEYPHGEGPKFRQGPFKHVAV